jgi:hypothetical protein
VATSSKAVISKTVSPQDLVDKSRLVSSKIVLRKIRVDKIKAEVSAIILTGSRETATGQTVAAVSKNKIPVMPAVKKITKF